METNHQEHHMMTMIRHVMSHGVITLLAVAIAFATPDIARFVLYDWWPRVATDSNLLLVTEILFASTLVIVFNLGKRAWDNHQRLKSARLASLVFARHPRKGWLKSLRERRLVHALPAVRDASIFSITGYNTLISDDSLLRKVIAQAYELRVMLLNPLSLAAVRRVDSLPDEVTLHTIQEELRAAIDFLSELRKSGKKVSLKFYDHEPFWKVVVLDDQAWVQHCCPGRRMDEQPEYVFRLEHSDPMQGLFVPFYTYFLHKWNDVGHCDYDFETAELIRRDADGHEIERSALGPTIEGPAVTRGTPAPVT